MQRFNKFESHDVFKWERVKDAKLVGKYDMPELMPCLCAEPRNPVVFHMAKSAKAPQDRWFHFFEDDYQFERIWNRPDSYLMLLKKFEGGISTDFSMYLDMPKAQQIWNCWRNRVMAYWMQRNGINVIPNACWAMKKALVGRLMVYRITAF